MKKEYRAIFEPYQGQGDVTYGKPHSDPLDAINERPPRAEESRATNVGVQVRDVSEWRTPESEPSPSKGHCDADPRQYPKMTIEDDLIHVTCICGLDYRTPLYFGSSRI